MYKIVRAEELAANIYLMDVEAPRVAKSCDPGQFLIVRKDEDSERIPLTIRDYDRAAGTVTIVVQVVGAATEMMRGMKAGDSFHDVVGPLGRPSEFVNEDLNSLQMGFKTLAIQRRSSEVWETLGAVKTEFEKFGGILEKAKNKIQGGLTDMDTLVGTRTRAIQRTLRAVEVLEPAQTERLPEE